MYIHTLTETKHNRQHIRRIILLQITVCFLPNLQIYDWLSSRWEIQLYWSFSNSYQGWISWAFSMKWSSSEYHETSQIIIGPGNGLMPTGNKPLPEPMLAHIYNPWSVYRLSLKRVLVNIGPGSGFMPTGNKPLPEPTLVHIYNPWSVYRLSLKRGGVGWGASTKLGAHLSASPPDNSTPTMSPATNTDCVALAKNLWLHTRSHCKIAFKCKAKIVWFEKT